MCVVRCLYSRSRWWALLLLINLLLYPKSLHLVGCSSSNSEDENFESRHQAAMGLISLERGNRDFRRGIGIFEELSLGIGRTSADALAELAAVHLFGIRPGFLNLVKAAQYSQRSASLGSPKGRHLYSFFLFYGGLGGITKNETEGWRQQELAAEQNYLPALMALGYRKLFITDDCESAVRIYRAGAISAMNSIETVYYGDFYSLRHMTMALDSLGDDYVAKAARDVETLNYWTFQSDRKDPKAFYELGRIYQLGLHGVRRDMAIAADHFERASNLGHPGALGELGRLYTLGHGREVDFNLALKHLQKGAEALDSNALASIGSLLIRKVYSSDDTNMPLLYLRKAVSLNSVEGEWELAQIELREGRLDAALQHLQRADKGGHVRSTMALAQLFDNGMGGLKRSCRDAAMMYKKVCETGHWVDQQYGPREGVKQFKKGRESSALTLSLLAALEGYEVAQFNAAWMLMRGKAMEEANIAFAIKPKKERKARYETASAVLLSLIHQNTHNSEASILLGDIYMGGHQIPHNQNLSAQLYEAAAEEGNVVGMERFALLLVSGRGVPCKDHKRAVQLMHHALSHISSGQSKVRGVHALLKQLVLSYRIMFVRLCDFIIGRLSFSTIRYAVARITSRIKLLSTPDRIYPIESLKGPKGTASVDLEGQNGAEGGTINESDRFLKSAITFPTIRYLSEESLSVAVPGSVNTDEGEAHKIETITSEKRIKGQGQNEGQGKGQGQGQGQKITAVKTGEDDWSKWRRLGRKVDVKESILEPVTGVEQSSQSHYAKRPDIPEGSSSGRLNIKRVGQKTGHVASRSTGSSIPASPETGPEGEGIYDTQGETGSSTSQPPRAEVGTRADALVKTGTQERGGAVSDVAPIGTEEGHATSHDRVDEKNFKEGRGQGKGQGASDDSLIAAVKSQQAATATAAAATTAAPVPTSYWSIMTEVLNESVRAPAATFFTSLYSYSYACVPKAVDAPEKATNFIPALGIQVQVRVDDEARLLEAEAEGVTRCNTAISNG